MRQNTPRQTAVTLVETLVATAIFSLMLGFLLVMVNGVQRAWLRGDQKVEVLQNGRAVLELMSRELQGTVVSDQIQFVQTPDLTLLVPNLAPNSSSLFWMAPGTDSEAGNLCEFGYYLVRDDAAKSYQLMRFFVRPNNTLYYLGTQAFNMGNPTARRPYSFANEALWITSLPPEAFDPANPGGAVSVAADGVVGLWIRCLDIEGNPIPWLSGASSYTSGRIQFSSGASFQMTTKADPFLAANPLLSNTKKTFQYTAGPTATAAQTKSANRPPASVEITLAVIDSRVLQRNVTIPPMPVSTDAEQVETDAAHYLQSLIDAGCDSAQLFTKRITLPGASL